jgi:hypothetical protein
MVDQDVERYCSSYYDKHGLYNDGFPCPDDKYCCQAQDGSKSCCDLNSLKKEQQKQQLNLDDQEEEEEDLDSYEQENNKLNAKSNKKPSPNRHHYHNSNLIKNKESLLLNNLSPNAPQPSQPSLNNNNNHNRNINLNKIDLGDVLNSKTISNPNLPMKSLSSSTNSIPLYLKLVLFIFEINVINRDA